MSKKEEKKVDDKKPEAPETKETFPEVKPLPAQSNIDPRLEEALQGFGIPHSEVFKDKGSEAVAYRGDVVSFVTRAGQRHKWDFVRHQPIA